MSAARERLAELLAPRLEPPGFERSGWRFRRHTSEIPQEAEIVASRFGAAVPGGAAWIDLHFGLPRPAGGGAAGTRFEPVLTLRHTQILPDAPAYYEASGDDARIAADMEALAAVLARSATADGFLAELDRLSGDAAAFATVAGRVLARLGRRAAARAAFLRSPDEPTALRRIAAASGIELGDEGEGGPPPGGS